MLGFENYCELEGLALRLVPIQSPGERQFGAMLGAGRVNTEKVMQNVTNKFRWGNFDPSFLEIYRFDRCFNSHRGRVIYSNDGSLGKMGWYHQ